MFTKRRARAIASALSLTLLAAALSACTTHIGVQMTALDCPRLVHPALRQPTPSATGPEDDTAGAWINFGVRQTGQLERSNVDREVILGIVDECYRQQQAAQAEAERRNKPWWRRIF